MSMMWTKRFCTDQHCTIVVDIINNWLNKKTPNHADSSLGLCLRAKHQQHVAHVMFFSTGSFGSLLVNERSKTAFGIIGCRNISPILHVCISIPMNPCCRAMTFAWWVQRLEFTPSISSPLWQWALKRIRSLQNRQEYCNFCSEEPVSSLCALAHEAWIVEFQWNRRVKNFHFPPRMNFVLASQNTMFCHNRRFPGTGEAGVGQPGIFKNQLVSNGRKTRKALRKASMTNTKTRDGTPNFACSKYKQIWCQNFLGLEIFWDPCQAVPRPSQWSLPSWGFCGAAPGCFKRKSYANIILACVKAVVFHEATHTMCSKHHDKKIIGPPWKDKDVSFQGQGAFSTVWRATHRTSGQADVLHLDFLGSETPDFGRCGPSRRLTPLTCLRGKSLMRQSLGSFVKETVRFNVIVAWFYQIIWVSNWFPIAFASWSSGPRFVSSWLNSCRNVSFGVKNFPWPASWLKVLLWPWENAHISLNRWNKVFLNRETNSFASHCHPLL